MPLPRPPAALALGLTVLAPAALIATGLAAQDASVQLDPVVLTTADAPPPGTSTAAPDQQAADPALDRLFRGMAGITTQGGTAAEPEMAVNIRGLQDNGRVAVSIDGARQNFARAGHGANGTFALDTEMLRSVTVTRGPGAAAGAIAGAVEFRTLTAADLIAEGESTGGEARLRYGSHADSPTVHAAWASRLGETADLTAALTRSDSGDYTAGDGRRVIARQDLVSGLLKAGWHLPSGHDLTLSARRMDRDYISGATASTPRDTDLRSTGLGLDHAWQSDGGLIDLTTNLYRSSTDILQHSLDSDLNPTGAQRSYDTETTGIRSRNVSRFDTGALAHELTLTLEAFEDRVITVDPGSESLTPSGRRSVWSLNAADRLLLGDTELTLGLSGDGYSLSSGGDGTSGQALSPRIAVAQPLGDSFSLHGALAQGYRPPSLNEALVDGSHPEPANFEVRPNPNLKGERAFSAEIGLGYDATDLFTANDSAHLRATVFRSDVDDYIGMERVGGVFNGYYQYANIARVRIEGVELEAGYESDRHFLTLTAQRLRGVDQDTGAELSRVAPDRLVLTAGLRDAAGGEYGARLTAVGAKTSGEFQSASWQTLDLFLTRPVAANGSLSLAVNNLFDTLYTPHLETQPAPGRNLQAALTLRF